MRCHFDGSPGAQREPGPCHLVPGALQLVSGAPGERMHRQAPSLLTRVTKKLFLVLFHSDVLSVTFHTDV